VAAHHRLCVLVYLQAHAVRLGQSHLGIFGRCRLQLLHELRLRLGALGDLFEQAGDLFRRSHRGLLQRVLEQILHAGDHGFGYRLSVLDHGLQLLRPFRSELQG